MSVEFPGVSCNIEEEGRRSTGKEGRGVVTTSFSDEDVPRDV